MALAATTVSLLAPSGCSQAAEPESGQGNARLLAKLTEFSVDKLVYSLGEPLGGTIGLTNVDAADQTGLVELAALVGDTVAQAVQVEFFVPAGTVQIYHWNGVELLQAGVFVCRATTALDQMFTATFTVG